MSYLIIYLDRFNVLKWLRYHSLVFHLSVEVVDWIPKDDKPHDILTTRYRTTRDTINISRSHGSVSQQLWRGFWTGGIKRMWSAENDEPKRGPSRRIMGKAENVSVSCELSCQRILMATPMNLARRGIQILNNLKPVASRWASHTDSFQC